MRKKDIQNLKTAIDDKYEIDECYDELVEKLNFKKQPKFYNIINKKLLISLSSLCLILIVSTFLITRAVYISNDSFQDKIIVKDDLIEEANEIILSEYDEALSIPIISLNVDDVLLINIYQGYSKINNEYIVYHQIIYEKNDYETIKIKFKIEDQLQVYEIDINQRITLAQTFSLDVDELNKLYIYIYKNNELISEGATDISNYKNL